MTGQPGTPISSEGNRRERDAWPSRARPQHAASEACRKPPKEPSTDEAASQEDLPTLRRRVAELTAQVEELTKDNDALRQQLARFQVLGEE